MMNGNQNAKKVLIVIQGPTASGKTGLSVSLAEKLSTVILSADSRQFYRQMSIGTAKPGHHELEEPVAINICHCNAIAQAIRIGI